MTTTTRVLQGNLNHCRAAQDLALQSIRETRIDLAVFAEPNTVGDRRDWLGDTEGSVLVISSQGPGIPPAVPRERGAGFVACEWRGFAVVAVYFSPNRRLAEFEVFLETLSDSIRRLEPLPVILAGDLNAKAAQWGDSRTDARGRVLFDWATRTGVDPLNTGREHTCVRANGGSVVDVTFASPTVARRIIDWRVVTDVETMSDHRYIRFDISSGGRVNGDREEAPPHHHHRQRVRLRRWALKSLDAEAFKATAVVESWPSVEAPRGASEIDEEALRLRDAMTRCCDAAMPRIGEDQDGATTTRRKSMYWWSEEIARMRRNCFTARRTYLRQRRRRPADAEAEIILHVAYVERRKELRAAIAQAKAQAWDELLRTLDGDPWGRPFEIVRKKLKARGAGTVTEALDPEALEHILGSLFPGSAEEEPPRATRTEEETVAMEADPMAYEVSEGEFAAAMRSMQRRGRTAPGPDGIAGRVWSLAVPYLGPRLRALFSGCLKAGLFPTPWKTGRLVLLEKHGRPPGTAGAYRPICILDEAGKLLERVIAERILYHLGSVGPDLDDRQYGFRRGRSTIDAIRRVIARAEEATSAGRVAIGVSVDIANAFNSIPTEHIEAALDRHGVPRYLRSIVLDYFVDRGVEYRVRGIAETVRRSVTRGVPQGSVLGPLLWDLAYDPVVREPIPRGLEVVCFADDTFAVATGDSWEEAIALAEEGAGLLVERIKALGLDVALSKCEAVGFRGPRRAARRGGRIVIGGASIPIGDVIRYLGLRLDGRLTFAAHFRALRERLTGEIGAFGRLMPNLNGPGDRCRRLYLAVVASIAMYGAPIWHRKLFKLRDELRQLHACQRTLNNRAIRGYRTISFEASCAVAGSPPWEFRAEVQGRLYEWRARERERGALVSHVDVETERSRLRKESLEKWAERLESERYGRRAIEAIGPRLEGWCSRRHGQLSYHLVQVLTGHGCFGKYLHKVPQREATPRCHHCAELADDADHTVKECPAWGEKREELTRVIGRDLSLPAIVDAMVGSKRSWIAVNEFCVAVITAKEAAERAREEAPDATPMRRRRQRRRPRIRPQ